MQAFKGNPGAPELRADPERDPKSSQQAASMMKSATAGSPSWSSLGNDGSDSTNNDTPVQSPTNRQSQSQTQSQKQPVQPPRDPLQPSSGQAESAVGSSAATPRSSSAPTLLSSSSSSSSSMPSSSSPSSVQTASQTPAATLAISESGDAAAKAAPVAPSQDFARTSTTASSQGSTSSTGVSAADSATARDQGASGQVANDEDEAESKQFDAESAESGFSESSGTGKTSPGTVGRALPPLGGLDQVREALVRTRVRQALQDVGEDHPVSCWQSDSLPDVLNRMCDYDVLQLPVLNNNGGYEGFVSMLHLVTCVTSLMDELGWEQDSSEDYQRAITKWRATTAGQVSRRPRRVETHIDASMWHAMENLAGWGQRYCALLGWNNQVAAVLCQSFFIKWMWQHRAQLGSLLDTAIWQLRPYHDVISVREDAQAIDGFRLIAKHGLGGIAVVDEAGKLSDVLSPRDLRRLRLGSHTFRSLFADTVGEFKHRVKQERGFPLQPVSLRKGSTFRDVLRLMVENGCIHRLFVVDLEGRPVDVISATDVLRWLLRQLGDGPQ